MNKKKMIIIGCVLLGILLLIILFFVVNNIIQDEGEDAQMNTVNMNMSSNEINDLNNLFGNTDASYDITEEDVEDDGYNSSSTITEIEDFVYDPGDTSVSNEDRYPYALNDSAILNNINQEQARQTAQNFLNSFMTYDTNSLKNNEYKNSWMSYVLVCSDNGQLLRTRLNDQWSRNVSTYDNVYSKVTDIQVDSIYVSHVTHENVIAASITCVIDENQGNPGEMEWEIVNTNRVHYSVYLNNDLKIIDVRRQDAQTLNTNIFNYVSNSPVQ